MLRASLYVITVLSLYFLSLRREPLYALIAYAVVYFIPPAPNIHWWAEYIPFSRWSFLSSIILILSFFFHRDKIIVRKFRSAHWLFLFAFFSALAVVMMPTTVSEPSYANTLITYCITVWFIIKIITTEEKLRIFFLSIITLSGVLSILAYLEGERVNARLEGIGSNDSFEANEFALLLTGILPLMLPLIFKGKKHEKIICILLLPFILNAFILCNSRGAAIALFIGLIYATFVVADKLIRKKIIIAMICTLPLFLYLMDPEYIERLSTLWTTEKSLEGEQSLNQLSSGRTEIWLYGIQMANDYPMGAGPNSFKHLARFYMPDEILTYKPDSPYGVRAAHNTYLQILVEQGYPGFIIWIMLCLHTLLLLRSGVKKLKSLAKADSFIGFTIFGITVSFVCSLAGGLTMSRIYYEFFWWQVALAIVAFSIITEAEGKEETQNNGEQQG
jgi:putative inorganic carbon (hco3(-)) transporter